MGTAGRKSRLGVHVGNMLMYAAGTYDSLLKTAIESVQNALDAEAKTVFVGIDLRGRFATIADDGQGVSPDKFAKALMAVGHSQKERQPDALGKFGLGLISPLDKCQFFEFISRAGRKGEIHAWVFDQERIRNSETDSDIDEIVLSDMPSLEETFQAEAERIGAVWNTIVRLHDIVADRVVSRLSAEKLASNIQSRFGDAMQNRGTTCYLFVRDERGQTQQEVVKPLEYRGEPLDGSPFVIDGSEAGKAKRITIELYRAVQSGGKRRGVIRVSDSRGAVYGIPLREFLLQVKRDLGYDTSEGFAELVSGYFEGLVRAELDITVKRDGFVANDPLLDFVIAFDNWYNKVGREFYEGERDRVRDDRYRSLTERSLTDVQEVLASRPDFKEFIQGIRDAVELGQVAHGGGSAEEGSAQALQFNQPKDPKRDKVSPGKGSSGKGQGPKTPKRPDNETDTLEQKPPNRTAVKGKALSLTIEVTEFELSNDLWRFDASTGRLSFNSGNDVWADLDGASSETRHLYHDNWVIQLQKWVITEVIRMLMLPMERWDDFATASRASARLHVDMCIKPYKISRSIT